MSRFIRPVCTRNPAGGQTSLGQCPIHAATAALLRAELFRLAAAAARRYIAVTNPLRAVYWEVDDVHLVDALEPDLHPDDGLIISPSGVFLVAFYGHWQVTITATNRHSHGTMATIGRDRTAYLFRGASEIADVTRFLSPHAPGAGVVRRLPHGATRKPGWSRPSRPSATRCIRSGKPDAAGCIWRSGAHAPEDVPR